MRNNKPYKAIDSSSAIVCEGLSRWTDFRKLANKIAEVVNEMEVPILQEIDVNLFFLFLIDKRKIVLTSKKRLGVSLLRKKNRCRITNEGIERDIREQNTEPSPGSYKKQEQNPN